MFLMRIPIPEVVVAVVVLLLFRFVPDLKERPWTVVCDASPSGRILGALWRDRMRTMPRGKHIVGVLLLPSY